MPRAIDRLLFLIRREPFVATEPMDDLPSGRYIKVTAIPAPGYRGLVVIGLSLFIGYGAFLALANWQLGGHWSNVLLPTLLVTANGSARACFKVRERRAAMVKWHEPVGRAHLVTRAAFGIVGFTVAGSAGWLLAEPLTGLPTLTSKLLAAGGLAVVEGLRNMFRIGGRYADPGFRIEDCERWILLDEA
jgi:hypothetical protein